MRSLLKILSLLLSATLLFSSCSHKKSLSRAAEWMEESGKIKTLSTIAQIGDLVTAVGGERVDGCVLVPAELDPHSYEIVKGDGEKLERADLIFYNGLGLEHGAGLSSFLRESGKGTALGDAIRQKAPEQILQKEGIIDPHVWMDVSLWKQAVQEIETRLVLKDPEGAAYYGVRARLLEEEMDKTHAYMRSLLQEVSSVRRFLITSHDAFRYFARGYLTDPGERDGSDRFTAPEGLAPDGQLSPVDIQRTLAFLSAHQISVLFPESNVSRDAVVKVAAVGRELGWNVRVCTQPLYGDSTGGLPYLEMMKRNAEVIAGQLREGEEHAVRN
ncbi:MAG: zinc ABC transporter substrate-binding protein [Chlamydiia bacterium]|nr:zinc ABC transporter substrate-binding protein [Chlamydiia bacterium]